MTSQSPSTAGGSASPSAASPSPFRVMPPAAAPAQSPSPSSPTPQSKTESSLASETAPGDEHPSKAANRRGVILGSIVLSLGLLSFVPVPYQVGGDVQLAWREEARQAVRPPIPAMVEAVLVQAGDRVLPGQALIQLSSRDLEREIAEVQEKLAQARRELAMAEQDQLQAQAALVEASIRADAARAQASHALDTIEQLQQGIMPPEIQQLQVERQRLQQQLQEVSTNIERFQDLYDAGAVSLLRLEEQQNLYRNIERDLAVNAERIQLAQQQLETAATREWSNIQQYAASVASSQMVVDIDQRIIAQQALISDLQSRLQALQQDQDALTLTATTAGTVITSDLDLFIGQEVQSDTTLMQIAELSQLTANVEIKEEDLDFVEMGASVTFRPRQAKLESYDARVEDILYNLEADATQQKQVATVRVVIDNPNERLRPGSSGYAKIFSEWTPLYRRVGREILKLIPERFL